MREPVSDLVGWLAETGGGVWPFFWWGGGGGGGGFWGNVKLVRAFVKRLRQKLGEDAARPAYIFTERG
ncbi:MAG: hypothetical protein OXG72_01475, partial [Acidobacteria bacterium]|nr:hypothetical protein [Acidobacteriota bacterium]